MTEGNEYDMAATTILNAHPPIIPYYISNQWLQGTGEGF